MHGHGVRKVKASKTLEADSRFENDAGFANVL